MPAYGLSQTDDLFDSTFDRFQGLNDRLQNQPALSPILPQHSVFILHHLFRYLLRLPHQLTHPLALLTLRIQMSLLPYPLNQLDDLTTSVSLLLVTNVEL